MHFLSLSQVRINPEVDPSLTRYIRILPRDRLSKCLEDRISLFNLIDTTKSVRQRNNLRNFFLNPVSDPDVIEKRHNIIQD